MSFSGRTAFLPVLTSTVSPASAALTKTSGLRAHGTPPRVTFHVALAPGSSLSATSRHLRICSSDASDGPRSTAARR